MKMQAQPGVPSKIHALLSRAIDAHKANRLEEAKRLYLEILALDVRHAKSLYGLGLIAHQSGNLDVAANMIGRAIAIDPKDAAFRGSLGAVLREQGKREEARAAYETALRLNPKDEEAHFGIAEILREAGELAEAEKHFRRAQELRPDLSEFHLQLALALQKLGRRDEAKTSFDRALQLDPKNIVALYGLGNLFFQYGQFEEAKTCFEQEAAIAPQMAEAYNGIGSTLLHLDRLEEAEAAYRKALELKPEYADVMCNLGNIARKRGETEEAREFYEQALALNPKLPEAIGNVGMILQSEGRLAEARTYFDRAIDCDPGEGVDAHWNRCILDLLEGKFEAGWAGYEYRRRRWQSAPRTFPGPLWRGEPLEGKRILLYSEQGMGDTVQFLRYVPLVEAAGGTVILDVPRSMVRLARQLRGVSELVAGGDPVPAFEWQCALMSLPGAFKTSLDSIPAEVPYLAPPEDARQKAERRSWAEGVLRVGVVWSGNPKFSEDKRRSIGFDTFARLFEARGVQFYSLQVGSTPERLSNVGQAVVDLAPAIEDFADTAALIAQLDLVVSVDTAVAHLAGALAKPVWTLLPFAPDWRWMLGREDSLWYPTMRLFRQQKAGDWTTVMERVREELETLAKREQGR